MIHAFCGALGAALCALGIAGLAVGSWVTEGAYADRTAMDAFYLASGFLTLMGTVERRWIARRICMAIGAVYGAVVALGLVRIGSTSAVLSSSAADLCVCLLVAIICLVASWQAKTSVRRRRHVYRGFDDRLTVPRIEIPAGDD